jgi:hypothetical protein
MFHTSFIQLILNRSQASKTDVDVLRVLENVELDFLKYPNISMWKDNMLQYNEDYLNM